MTTNGEREIRSVRPDVAGNLLRFLKTQDGDRKRERVIPEIGRDDERQSASTLNCKARAVSIFVLIGDTPGSAGPENVDRCTKSYLMSRRPAVQHTTYLAKWWDGQDASSMQGIQRYPKNVDSLLR